MLIIENISFQHQEVLFDTISLSLAAHQKIALVGNNGSGKSTLLRLITGELIPVMGNISRDAEPYYVPQICGQYDHLSVAVALKADAKLHALQEILGGNGTAENFAVLDDDWAIEERCREALAYWQLESTDLWQPLGTLSGGQKVKVFLAGITLHKPKLVLLDEPTNHLDTTAREQVYEWIRFTSGTLIVVSHDRKLLNLLDGVYEVTRHGLQFYNGNYESYASQKQAEKETLSQQIHHSEKALRQAKTKERETMERQQKLDARGKRKHQKEGVARIMMNTLRNNAEKSTANIKGVHAEKIAGISDEIKNLRAGLPAMDQMRFGFDEMNLHKGKRVFSADVIQYMYQNRPVWQTPVSMEIRSGDRIALNGVNGSGKTTLINVLLGKLDPHSGSLLRSAVHAVYIDQDYSLLQPEFTVYQQAQSYNSNALQEHEVKIRLNRFLFTVADWDKPCSGLSGGERLRLVLCCLTIGEQAPDLIILDEPTNNLDLQNIGILTEAIRRYRGTLVVVSHDQYFLEQIGIEEVFNLDSRNISK